MGTAADAAQFLPHHETDRTGTMNAYTKTLGILVDRLEKEAKQ